jgi:poly(3-hydroxybutyrate) depolymerase
MAHSLALAVAVLALALPAHADHHQDTGFLNRRITVSGISYKYQVYLPEQWSPKRAWPIILFLHGSGERGSDGTDQTQIGLPAAIRSHPDRWPFVVVMPQVPYNHRHWTDPDMMTVAMKALDTEVHEFRGDPQRTYLTGLSLGGYGTWEIAKNYPHRFSAIVPVCGGVFWSYSPQRWHEPGLAETYAHAVGRTPIWIFHGADDPVVSPRQSVLMYEALSLAGGNVRFWEYAGWKHNVWDKAYAEPELPRWLLAHRLSDVVNAHTAAERVLVPIHPVPARVNSLIYEAYEGEYEVNGVVETTITRQGESLFSRNRIGESQEILPESPTTFFYLSGSATRLTFEKDAGGQVKGIRYHDDRHEEFWERKH